MRSLLLPLALTACGGPDPCCMAADTGTTDDPADCVAQTGSYPEPPSCSATAGLAWLPPTPPNVMLVIDRSGSMQPHWGSLLHLTPYIEGMGALTHTGLTLFPGGGACTQTGELVVPLGEDNGDAVLDAIERSETGGTTPMVETLTQLRTSEMLQDPGRDNVLILVADGQPTGSADPFYEVGEWAVLPVPVKMHFISFAAGSEARSVMEGMAASTPTGFHYSADDITELAARLDRVAASLSPCGYALETPVDAVDVALDGEALEPCTDEDCTDGFAYDAESGIVTLAPWTCRQAAAQACADVVITAR